MCFGEQLAKRDVIYVLVRLQSNVGEGTLGVDELVGDRVVGLITCGGEGDVVGVVAPLGGVAQVIFHGVQVVEVGVQVSAHNQFPAITQAEKMIDRTGKPVTESSSSAQIRTLFDEQRQMIIAECCEKNSQHELQAARAEQDRQILQEELWRQQKDFREVHQQNLTKMEELRKFQSSTFDTHAKLIKK